jgi:tetratricopeptide (TPR) repeat protein
VPRAESVAARNDFGMALALLDQASFTGWDYHLALDYGQLHRRHGNRVDALEAFMKARRYLPQGRSALNERGELLVELGAVTTDRELRERIWADAERALNLVHELRPPYADAGAALSQLAEARATCNTEAPPCLR